MTLIVDASVALKWVLQEDGSEPARALLTAEPLAAPDLLWIECASVLAVKVRRGLMAPEAARVSLGALQSTPVRIVPSGPHIAEAHRMAVDLSHSAYDCLYLALALDERAVLVTADTRFAAAATPAYGASIRTL